MDKALPSVDHLSINQLLQLVRLILARVQALRDIELDELTTQRSPHSGSVAASSAAGSWIPVGQGQGQHPPVPIPVWSCPYECQFCSDWCSRPDEGHRHHRCRQHRRR